MIRHVLSLAVVVLAAGCASVGDGPGGASLPDAGSAAARHYAARCGACHAAPHPRRLSYPAWNTILPLMERRMRERGLPALGDVERTEILAYLRAHAR